MLCFAQFTGEHAVIFPEGVALALGVWTLGRPEWCESRFGVVGAPTLCAVVGTLAANLLPPGLPAQLAALVGALVVLLGLPSRLGPALSAAVLPTVFDVRSWVYPVAVLVIAGVLVGGLLLRGRTPGPARRWPFGRAFLLLVVSTIWLIAAHLLRLPIVAMAPPLLVSCFEGILTRPAPRVQVRHVALLTAGWSVGAVAAHLVHIPPLAGMTGLVVTTGLIWVTRTGHAPVLAMSLVPEVAGAPGSWGDIASGAGTVALAASALFLLATAFGRLLPENSRTTPFGQFQHGTTFPE